MRVMNRCKKEQALICALIISTLFICSIPCFGADVNAKIGLVKSGLQYEPETQKSTLNVALKNTGDTNLSAPVKVIIDQIHYAIGNDMDGDGDVDGMDLAMIASRLGTPDGGSMEQSAAEFGQMGFPTTGGTGSSGCAVLLPDGLTAHGKPYFLYNSQIGGGQLAPGAQSDAKQWSISTPVEEYQSGRAFSFDVRVFAGSDASGPSVRVAEPEDGSIIDTATPYVMITFTDDDSGINLSSLDVQINGADNTSFFTITDTKATCQTSTALPSGENVLSASVRDNAGNMNTATSTFSVRPNTDDDSDDLADWWELENFGDLNQTGAGDADGDGISNLDEFLAGTDPNNDDIEGPDVISSWPPDDGLVATQGGSVTINITFGDTGSGIRSVRLLDQNGVDITDQAIITDNNIQLLIKNPSDGAYCYTLVIEDMAGNKTTRPFCFTVDTTIPMTTASIDGGRFTSPIAVDLSCLESATVYYSTDGYPPFVGAANTTAGSAPIQGIAIDSNAKLQFFAIDTAGNIEPTQSEIYYFDKVPESIADLSAIYNEPQACVELSWSSPSGPAIGYHVYRCVNAQDQAILDQSRNGGYAPPARLRLVQDVIPGTSYNDTEFVSGITYRYGVTVIDDKDVEGPISDLVSVTVPVATQQAENKTEAIERAKAWLESVQNEQGYWGDKEGTWMLATTQVLNAFKAAGTDNAAIRQTLFYLRGHLADNNDFLARKIQTLHDYGQNVDELVNRLISQGSVDGIYLLGWGSQKGFAIDALDTALGEMVIYFSWPLPVYNYAEIMLESPFLQANVADRFGWLPSAETSIYVSSLVYHVTKPYYSPQWIIDSQNGDGSFGNSAISIGPPLIDTAATLIWLDISNEAIKNDAISYLISQQNLNGSWNDDPNLTGLCLEALLK